MENEVNDILKNIPLDNNSDDYTVYDALSSALYYDVSVHGFTLTPAVGTTKGSATGTIVVEDYHVPFVKVPFNLSVSQGTTKIYDERYSALYQAADTIENGLKDLSVSNSTNDNDIRNWANSEITNSNIAMTFSDFEFYPKTDTKIGDIEFTIEFTDTTNNLKCAYHYLKDIHTSATANTTASVNSYLASLVPSNNLNEDDILAGINKEINDSTVKVNICDFYLRKADSYDSGYCNFYVDMNDSYDNSFLGAVTQEVAKAIEAQVVTNLTNTLGQGTVAGQAKEIATVDGAKVSVTPLIKDGKGTGTVITAEVPSASAVIPIDKDAAPVAAVYKFVPLLGKYIQVQDAVITQDAITLPVQANATYVASPVVMSEAETVAPGWVYSGSNWYRVNATGDPVTGWQQDGRGWTYMSSTTGAMQTGWVKDNDKWYYMKSSGYMSTGWVKDGYKWYYCNGDGSMATNTTVNGYKLNASGAWIG